MIQDNYIWEAEKKDGTILTTGEYLEDVVRFSFIPTNFNVQRHDIIGVPLIRRFNRGFINGLGGGMKEYLLCVVSSTFRLYVKSSNGVILITPPDYELYL